MPSPNRSPHDCSRSPLDAEGRSWHGGQCAGGVGVRGDDLVPNAHSPNERSHPGNLRRLVGEFRLWKSERSAAEASRPYVGPARDRRSGGSHLDDGGQRSAVEKNGYDFRVGLGVIAGHGDLVSLEGRHLDRWCGLHLVVEQYGEPPGRAAC